MLHTSLTLVAMFSGMRSAGGLRTFLRLRTVRLAIGVQPVHAFVVDAREVQAQQVVHASISKATPRVRGLHDLGLQRRRLGTGHRRMPVAVSA